SSSALLICPHALSSLCSFTAPPTTPTYTLSLHDALPISLGEGPRFHEGLERRLQIGRRFALPHEADEEPRLDLRHHLPQRRGVRSEEHTSELQSPYDLVCRLLLEKKKQKKTHPTIIDNPH